MVMFEFVVPYVPSTHCVLPMLQQFLMVLMKLQLNLADQDLAYRFVVHLLQGTLGKLIDVLYGRLHPLILWPEQLLKQHCWNSGTHACTVKSERLLQPVITLET